MREAHPRLRVPQLRVDPWPVAVGPAGCGGLVTPRPWMGLLRVGGGPLFTETARCSLSRDPPPSSTCIPGWVVGLPGPHPRTPGRLDAPGTYQVGSGQGGPLVNGRARPGVTGAGRRPGAPVPQAGVHGGGPFRKVRELSGSLKSAAGRRCFNPGTQRHSEADGLRGPHRPSNCRAPL